MSLKIQSIDYRFDGGVNIAISVCRYEQIDNKSNPIETEHI